MADVSPSDPLESRVLAALMSGAATAADVALRTGQPVELVGPILTRSVTEQTVTLLGRGRTPAYSLTPKGLHAIGIHQGVPDAVDGSDPVDRDAEREQAGPAPDDGVIVPSPAPLTGAGSVAGGLPPARVEVDPPGKKVTWRHVVYAAAYVVLGLFFLLLQPVFGAVVIVAGLALGAYALRPLWRPGSVGVTND